MTREIDSVRLANLDRLVAEAGSGAALARRAGTSSAYLSQIRSGAAYPSGGRRRVGDRLAGKLEKAMHKPAGWMDRPATADQGPAAGWETGGRCPLISWAEAAAWTGAPDFPGAAARLHCPVLCGADTFALRVSGTSMEPRFVEGDLIFADPARVPAAGSFVVVRNSDGTAILRQLGEEGGRRYLTAANPDWPQRIVEADEAEVLGVVVFRGRRM